MPLPPQIRTLLTGSPQRSASPGVQLLVVDGRHPAPQTIQSLIDAKRYRDAYMAMTTESAPDSRIFFQDLGADGLRGTSDGAVDVAYERVVNRVLLNGNPDSNKLTPTEYSKNLEELDREYAKSLSTLIDAARRNAVSAAGSTNTPHL